MCQLIAIVLLFVVGLSYQAVPFKMYHTANSGKVECTRPMPNVSTTCLKEFVEKQVEIAKCANDKQGFWDDMITGAANDTEKLLFYACCGLEDMLTCINILEGSCSSTEMDELKNYTRGCATDASQGLLTCDGLDIKACPSGGYRLVVNVLSVIILFALAIFLNNQI